MSATQDKSQKTTFVYSNLYQLYRKGKDAAEKAELGADPSFHVIKTADLKLQKLGEAAVKIEEYSPQEFIGPRILSRAVQASPAQDSALASLKQNVKSLQDLHSRLRFMLKELEELSRDE
jgi:hypothetical protein